MLRLIGFVLKVGIFSVVVILLSHVVHWRGKTVSDQVRVGMAQVEREMDRIPGTDSLRRLKSKTASGASAGDLIPESERQKLRALIRELNGSR